MLEHGPVQHRSWETLSEYILAICTCIRGQVTICSLLCVLAVLFPRVSCLRIFARLLRDDAGVPWTNNLNLFDIVAALNLLIDHVFLPYTFRTCTPCRQNNPAVWRCVISYMRTYQSSILQNLPGLLAAAHATMYPNGTCAASVVHERLKTAMQVGPCLSTPVRYFDHGHTAKTPG